MRELGFEHQYCIFHLQLNIKDKIKQYFRTKEQKHKSKIKKEHPTWSKFKIKKETKKHFKEERHEINNYLKFFMKLFDCETYKEALEYIELIKQELNNFPPILKEYLTKNFLPEYKKYIVFLKDEFKGKLDRTNNKTENYIENTLPKAHKNKFRTNQGLFDHIYLRSIRWKKNQRNQLTN